MLIHKYSLIISILLGSLFIIYPELDIKILQFVFDPNIGFIFANHYIILLISKSVIVLSWILISIILIFLFKIVIFANYIEFIKSPAMLLVLSIILGPGLMVNGILKEHIGRARPKHIIEFGGSDQFTPAGYSSNSCKHNCSFVSGHASIGFYLIIFAWIVLKQYRNIIFVFAIFLGILIGSGRVLQGAHFPSDIIFTLLIILCTTELSLGIWQKIKKRYLVIEGTKYDE